jgi:hypothetical protein
MISYSRSSEVFNFAVGDDHSRHKNSTHWEEDSGIATVEAQKKASDRKVILQDDVSEPLKSWAEHHRNWPRSASRKIENQVLRPSYSSTQNYRSVGALWWEVMSDSRSYNVFKPRARWRSYPPQKQPALRAAFRNDNGLFLRLDRFDSWILLSMPGRFVEGMIVAAKWKWYRYNSANNSPLLSAKLTNCYNTWLKNS